MGSLETEKFKEAVNNDPEFAIAGRYWNATIKLAVGDETVIIKVKDGAVTDLFEPSGRTYLIQVRE